MGRVHRTFIWLALVAVGLFLTLVVSCGTSSGGDADAGAPCLGGCAPCTTGPTQTLSCAGSAVVYECVPRSQEAVLAPGVLCTPPVDEPGLASEEFCCLLANHSTTCSTDPAVPGCPTSSYGVVCGGSDTPQAAVPSLTCVFVQVDADAGNADAGTESRYCCVDQP